MIEYITGQIKQKSPANAVVEINGIAYRLLIPASTYEKLSDSGNVTLYTSLIISGGMQTAGEFKLFGFFTQEERQLFQMLCSVTRIGPLLALRMLSGASVNQIKQAIASDNLAFLARIKGVGDKTAQRIVLELKDTIKSATILEPGTMASSNFAITEAILVLAALGYQRSQAEKCIKEAIDTLRYSIENTGIPSGNPERDKKIPDLTTETLVKYALKHS